jgi:hypothetical protein
VRENVSDDDNPILEGFGMKKCWKPCAIGVTLLFFLGGGCMLLEPAAPPEAVQAASRIKEGMTSKLWGELMTHDRCHVDGLSGGEDYFYFDDGSSLIVTGLVHPRDAAVGRVREPAYGGMEISYQSDSPFACLRRSVARIIPALGD